MLFRIFRARQLLVPRTVLARERSVPLVAKLLLNRSRFLLTDISTRIMITLVMFVKRTFAPITTRL